jgi:hypothetical protein
MGRPETCNALDDNCNGIVDENIPGTGEACSCANVDMKTLTTGECKPGVKECKGREPLDCVGCIPPVPEICDCKDNNCNGSTDEGELCGRGFACVDCKCQIPCGTGEFRCPSGYYCDESVKDATGKMLAICRNLKCQGVKCEPGQRCDEQTGKCVDPCAGVTCPSPQQCREGKCVDCRDIGCPTGQICRENGACEANPCATKTCGTGQYCDDGACFNLTCSPSCGSGELCTRGACKVDPCLSVTCNGGEVCDPETGTCKADACTLKVCPFGQKCVPLTGACKTDPCASLDCGNPCFRCEVGANGAGRCVQQGQCTASGTTTAIMTRGGGCSCTLPGQGTGEAGGLGATVGLALLALALRRRGAAPRRP